MLIHERRPIVPMLMLLAMALLCAGAPASTPSRPAIELQTTKLADNLYLLAGAGGNIALCTGDDGPLLVDCGLPQAVDALVAAVRTITPQPIRTVINTHWHFDHVGGNERLAAGGAVIIAHTQVRSRMIAPEKLRGLDFEVAAAPPRALPRVTFDKALMLHVNDETIEIIPIAPAHTDGDSFVHFREANILHVGDTCSYPMYPFIDTNSGGNIDGLIAAADRALHIANADTKIIPGHGPLITPDGLREFRGMLVTVRDRVRMLIDEGRSRDQVIAAKPTADLDKDWAKAFGPELWVGWVYDGIVRAHSRQAAQSE